MKKLSYVLAIIGAIIIIAGIIYEIVDFYNDYQCSTSQDINWFMENNCMRYVEREIRNK